MKKLFTLLCSLVLLGFYSSAQYFYVPHLAPGQNPGGLCTDDEYPVGGGQVAGWTSIHAGSAASPAWSTTATIPFTFNFNSNPVTSFKASTTGVVTFTTAAVTAPPVANVAIPDASIPDNSIMAWGITGSGTNDNICTKTFGTAPNRQHWIMFSSYTDPGNGAYTYFAIVLEETTDKIYIIDLRDGGSALTLTLGLQINSSTACQVNGSPNIAAIAGTDPTPADNVYYEFAIGTLPAVDAAISDVTPLAGVPSSFTLVGAVNTIGATVTNNGTNTITSVTFKYSDGVNTWSDVKAVNIPTFGTATITHTTTYTTPSTGNHPLTVWIEVTGDANAVNDNGNTQVQGVTFFPTHAVVFEEGTGTWCGWCPRGAVFMDSMAVMHGGETVLIAVHNSDPMEVTDYDAGIGGIISGYPSVVVNRNIVADPSAMFVQFNARIADFGYANLSQTTLYNGTSFAITANADFAADLSGDYRFAVVITEDDVTGTAAGWEQANYYSASQPLQGAGHNWMAEPNPVPAANMEYDHVARVILGGFDGQAGSLPGTISAGSQHSYNFNWNVPAGVDVNKTHINVILIDAANDLILNGATGTFTGVNEPDAIIGSTVVFPNPAKDQASVMFNLKNSQQVMLEVYNSMGQLVNTENKGMLPSGQHTFQIDTRGYAAGLYSVNIVVNGKASIKKLIVE